MARSCVSIPANSADSPRGGNHPTAGFKLKRCVDRMDDALERCDDVSPEGAEPRLQLAELGLDRVNGCCDALADPAFRKPGAEAAEGRLHVLPEGAEEWPDLVPV